MRARNDLDQREIAIASASHLARPEQLDAVRSLLAKAHAGEDELECGPDGQPPARIKHNCSGKHAGMLLTCRANGWRSDGYRLPGHRMQRACLEEVADAAGVDADSIQTGIDGCGVVTFALPLRAMARAFARFGERDGAVRVVDSMRAYPELIRGPGAPDTELMRAVDGWTAKGGAEGCFCATGPDGLGVALKTEDGGYRAMHAALAAFLARVGPPLPEDFGTRPVRNSRGDEVGAIALLD